MQQQQQSTAPSIAMLPPAPPPPPPPSSDAPTLLVKHLPGALPLDTLKRLFSHYGASDIRPCVAARMKNCAFVEFKDEAQAARAQSQLHRLRFLGKILTVEKAKPYSPKTLPQDQTERLAQARATEGKPLPSSLGHSETVLPASGRRAEPIASSLGVDYPFPPHLEYAYPPADGNILTNIVNAMIAVPRLYTQVLHLMNKMNLPAPFRPALPTPPLGPPPPPPPPPEPAAPPCLDRDLSSDESELESSEEMGSAAVEDAGEVGGDNEKRAKRKRNDAVEAAAEARTASLVPTERPLIKKRRPVVQINISSKGKGQDHEISRGVEVPAGPVQTLGIEETDQMKEETLGTRNSATREELITGKMPSNELFALPMFKNYTRGMPTPVLYIKNLAKDVTQDDLNFVFGAVFANYEEAQSQLGVRLMQEGRMRGQAFVTFPSTELAEDALNVVHGYMLKGKPMVVQFGRNPEAAAKKS